MHTALSLLLFAPAICFALGAEDTGFYGVLDGGKLVRLPFKDVPQNWPNRNVVYGTSEPAALFFAGVQTSKRSPPCFHAHPPRRQANGRL